MIHIVQDKTAAIAALHHPEAEVGELTQTLCDQGQFIELIELTLRGGRRRRSDPRIMLHPNNRGDSYGRPRPQETSCKLARFWRNIYDRAVLAMSSPHGPVEPGEHGPLISMRRER